jgi:hypothetical protein
VCVTSSVPSHCDAEFVIKDKKGKKVQTLSDMTVADADDVRRVVCVVLWPCTDACARVVDKIHQLGAVETAEAGRCQESDAERCARAVAKTST